MTQLYGPANRPIFDPAPIIGQDKVTVPAASLIPQGGTTGQVLAKASGADYDIEWVDQSGGGGGVNEAQFGFGGLVAPSAEAFSAPYMMASATTFTQVIVTMSTESASAYAIKVYVDAALQSSFTVAANTGGPNDEHIQVVSIAVAAGQVVQASIGAAPLATGENVLIVCR